jgi:hypothetical protein
MSGRFYFMTRKTNWTSRRANEMRYFVRGMDYTLSFKKSTLSRGNGIPYYVKETAYLRSFTKWKWSKESGMDYSRSSSKWTPLRTRGAD